MQQVTDWVEASPYARALGVHAEAVSPELVRLRLPFSEANTNPGQVLHGGVAASLAVIAGQAVARATLGEEAAPFHTAQLQLAYLAAARAQAVVASARRLRAGRELSFAEVAVTSEDGKPVAHALVSVRGRFGAPPAPLPDAPGDDGASDPGPMGPHIEKLPFLARLGVRIEHMTGARSRIVLPWHDALADGAGGVHEGALLALLDTTGAMAAWAVTGPGRYSASTPALQAQILAPPGPEDLIARGRSVHHDGEAHWSDVTVAGAGTGRIVARGTVQYRIVR